MHNNAQRVSGLSDLRRLTLGRPDLRIALIDVRVDLTHKSLAKANIVQLEYQEWAYKEKEAVSHATFLASILVGNDDIGICPACTLVALPIMDDQFVAGRLSAQTAALRLAQAVSQAIRLGVSVIHMSLDFLPEAGEKFNVLSQALKYASLRGVRTVIAAGNRGEMVSSVLLATPGVVPVAMAGADGRPDPRATLGILVGSRGLLAPGTRILGIEAPDKIAQRDGSSFAAAFVTSAFLLLRASFEEVSSDLVWNALLNPYPGYRHVSVSPPTLNVNASFHFLQQMRSRIYERPTGNNL